MKSDIVKMFATYYPSCELCSLFYISIPYIPYTHIYAYIRSLIPILSVIGLTGWLGFNGTFSGILKRRVRVTLARSLAAPRNNISAQRRNYCDIVSRLQRHSDSDGRRAVDRHIRQRRPENGCPNS